MSSRIAAMFSNIAGVYDLLNHLLSFGIDRSWRRELAALAPEKGPLLDLAAGTLDVALALRADHPQIQIIAADLCEPMLRKGVAKLKSPELKAAILPCVANALELPLPRDSVTGITIAFGIRNITPRLEAFREMLRVLKPGGRACVLEFGSASERIWFGLYNIYLDSLLPLIGRMIARDGEAYEYLARTIRAFPAAPALAHEMEEAGFRNVVFRKLTGGIVCLHWGEKPTEATAPEALQTGQPEGAARR